jgi:hypothetical protein
MPLRARMGSPVVGEMVVMVSTDMVTDGVRCGAVRYDVLIGNWICLMILFAISGYEGYRSVYSFASKTICQPGCLGNRRSTASSFLPSHHAAPPRMAAPPDPCHCRHRSRCAATIR